MTAMTAETGATSANIVFAFHDNGHRRRNVTGDKKKTSATMIMVYGVRSTKTPHNSIECFALKKQCKKHKPAEI